MKLIVKTQNALHAFKNAVSWTYQSGALVVYTTDKKEAAIFKEWEYVINGEEVLNDD